MNTNFNYHSKQDLAVIWTPKAGCTIVNKMFFEEEGLLEDALKYSIWIHNYRMTHSKQQDVKKMKQKAISSENKVTKWIQFTVNPYRRAVSSYIHCCKHPIACLGLEVYNKSFKSFLEDIVNEKIQKPNGHFFPQVFYKEKDIEYIKLENLDEMLPYINKKYNLSYKLQSSHHHAKLDEENKEFVGDKPYNIVKENIPANYCNFYDEEIKNLVEEYYNLDFKKLNYTWDEFFQSQELDEESDKELDEESDKELDEESDEESN